MSHEVGELDRPAYHKDPAWHGLGIVVPNLMEAENVLNLASMDYEVEKQPVFAQYTNDNGDTVYFQVPDQFVTVRKDLHPTNPIAYLGSVGSSYTTIQNHDLVDFCKALSETEPCRFETAGTLRNGKLAWVLGLLPTSIQILDDKCLNYLLVSTAHDGTNAFVAAATAVRVVCWNTLSAAIAGASYRYAVRHTNGSTWRIEEAKFALTHAETYRNAFTGKMLSFATKACDKRFVEGFLNAVVGDTPETHKTKAGIITRTQVGRKKDELRDLIYGGQIGSESDAIGGRNGKAPTAYGLYNALTQWGETTRAIRKTTDASGQTKSENEARAESVLFGSFARLRDVAVGVLDRAINGEGFGQPVAEMAEMSELAGSGVN